MNQNQAQTAVICGMTKETAERYLEIRRKIAIITHRLHTSGYHLNEFEKVAPTDLCHALALTGKMVMYNATLIYDHLENQFASMQTVYEAIQRLKK